MGKYYTVSEDDQDIRIDKFLRKVLQMPQSLIEKFLRKGMVLLDNMKVKSGTKIKTGSVIYIKYDGTIYSEKKVNKAYKVDTSALVDLIRNNIIYENDNVLVINKPAGIPVQGGTKVKVSISDVLDKIKDGEPMKIVHRLDKDTSGALILARNIRACRSIMHEFKNRKVKKKYLALAQGILENDAGQINYSIIKKKCGILFEKMATDKSHVQEAITLFSVLKRLPNNILLLELQPITGRKHQIRVHLSHIGCPIIGDKKYGKLSCTLNDHLQLHAYSISINIEGKNLSIIAPIPSHMESTIIDLEKSS
ncbi:MAG: RluA family pseudouridine synthase [Ehrlichia sp.]